MKTSYKITIVVVVIGFIGLILLRKPTVKKRTKQENIFLIVSKGKSSNSDAMSKFEDAYIEAWADAVEKGKANFDYLGKIYNTQGGKAIVIPKS